MSKNIMYVSVGIPLRVCRGGEGNGAIAWLCEGVGKPGSSRTVVLEGRMEVHSPEMDTSIWSRRWERGILTPDLL